MRAFCGSAIITNILRSHTIILRRTLSIACIPSSGLGAVPFAFAFAELHGAARSFAQPRRRTVWRKAAAVSTLGRTPDVYVVGLNKRMPLTAHTTLFRTQLPVLGEGFPEVQQSDDELKVLAPIGLAGLLMLLNLVKLSLRSVVVSWLA